MTAVIVWPALCVFRSWMEGLLVRVEMNVIAEASYRVPAKTSTASQPYSASALSTFPTPVHYLINSLEASACCYLVHRKDYVPALDDWRCRNPFRRSLTAS